MTSTNLHISRVRITLASIVCLTCIVAAIRLAAQSPGSDGWQIPDRAATEANPVPISPATLARGRSLYTAKCQGCHGRQGKGDGPDGDRTHPPADLTDADRASRNPDGVMFYKIWNGRAKPRMPAMKADLAPGDVWALIHYVKTLRHER